MSHFILWYHSIIAEFLSSNLTEYLLGPTTYCTSSLQILNMHRLYAQIWLINIMRLCLNEWTHCTSFSFVRLVMFRTSPLAWMSQTGIKNSINRSNWAFSKAFRLENLLEWSNHGLPIQIQLISRTYFSNEPQHNLKMKPRNNIGYISILQGNT